MFGSVEGRRFALKRAQVLDRVSICCAIRGAEVSIFTVKEPHGCWECLCGQCKASAQSTVGMFQPGSTRSQAARAGDKHTRLRDNRSISALDCSSSGELMLSEYLAEERD